MKKMDMHMHSVHSDGSKTPEELFNMANELDIGTMAITDHDNIDGSKELMHYTELGLNLYSGVELTAKVSHGRMHILGYNIDLDNSELNSTLKAMKEASIYNLLLYIEVLKRDKGITFPQSELDELFAKPGNIGRPQLALIMIKLGICQTVDEAFDNYLNYAYQKVRKVKKGLTKEDCLTLINGAGGVAVLAHPVSLKLTEDELEKEIEYLKDQGLGGIEVYHIHNQPKDRELFLEYAKKYDLLISGGTDYHGEEVKPNVKMGSGIDDNINIPEGSLTLTKNIKSRYMVS